MKTQWAAASARFNTTFVNNPFGHKCDVCNRLWVLRSLKPTKEKHLQWLNNTFPGEPMADFQLCEKGCYKTEFKWRDSISRLKGDVPRRSASASRAGPRRTFVYSDWP
ncbi:hypothetical protein EVAR_36309_1 [Eumeta japonica]|uniref:Uncharacterized protein n=1 Tax=Eumeta variegata TaxID=151549 RepID=A0A4C1VJ87_EUMVA|nr:hypothetical protein EVAR_36309_1 [Eumeta japonica]